MRDSSRKHSLSTAACSAPGQAWGTQLWIQQQKAQATECELAEGAADPGDRGGGYRER